MPESHRTEVSTQRADGAAQGDVAEPLFSATDLKVIVGLPALALLSWLLPFRFWPVLSRRFAAEALEAVPDRGRDDDRKLVDRRRAVAARDIEDTMLLLRAWAAPRLLPRIRLEGAEHLDRAIQAGNGAILWVADTTFYSLVSKLALSRAGYRVSHLSSRSHGFSSSRFGMAVLNPIRTLLECRYLAERVVLGRRGATAALRTLRHRLSSNGVVSITARGTAARPVLVRLLGIETPLGCGAPELAYLSGAALLPTFTVLRDGYFTVTVTPSVTCGPEAEREEAVQRMVEAFAGRLARCVRSHPDQWHGWYYL